MRRSFAADDLIILPQKRFFVKHFFEKLLKFYELGALHTSQCQLVFSASIGSFQGLPAEASEVILLSQRLALKYNTTHRDSCQHFLTSFFQFLCGGGLGQNSNRKEPSQASLRDVRFPLLSLAVTFSPGRGKSVLSGGALLALIERCTKAPPFGGAGAQRLRGFSPILLHYIGRANPNRV